MPAQSWLNRIWYGGGAPPSWLVPLSLAYRAAAGAHRLLYAGGLRRTIRLSRPVIVVGNLTVGGTGKTPLVCWLVARLAERGFVPGVVTRGYGGRLSGERLVRAGDLAQEVGDEPVLIARRTGAPVAVGRDRPAAAQLLIEAGCRLIVSDDGLQHHRLARDCEIIVVDGERRFGNGRLLPAGPLRESRARLGDADAVVVNGGAAPPPGELAMRLEAGDAVALDGSSTRPLARFAGLEVHAVAGIGNPVRFFDLLRAHGIGVIEHALPDHAPIAGADLDFADSRPVLMTEKDAVKCTHRVGSRHWYVPVSAQFDAGESTTLLEIVTERTALRGTPRETTDG